MNIKDNPEVSRCIEYVANKNRIDAENGIIRRACVITFGCQQNEADSEKLRGMAKQMGYIICDDVKNASLILVNTCAIREHAEQKALSVIGTFKHLKEASPGMIIGVCGCMSAEAHRVEALKKSYPYVDFSLEPSAISRLPVHIAKVMQTRKRHFVLGEGSACTVEGIPTDRQFKHRAWVSIMYGCNNFCSYCIVPYVRGRERSRASTDILEEIASLVNNGCREITLLGQNVNSYRGDCDFATLLERAAQLPGDFCLKFMTSHPKDVPDRLIQVIAENPKITRQFHLPVQSGSDRILHAMNRRYTRKSYLETVRKIREAIPDAVLTSDIIVGFPGESEADFEDTLSLLREVRFDMIYSFLYSPRTGTPAAKMPCQVPQDVKNSRFARLLEVQNKISFECNQPYIGRTVRVLVDGVSKNDPDMMSGRTFDGKLVHFRAPEANTGDIIQIIIERAEAFTLYGKPV